MGTVVLDSSVVLGLLDPRDVHHPAAYAALRIREGNGDRFLVPTVVLAEVLVGAARAAPDAVEATYGQLVEAFGSTRHFDDDVALAAARLRSRHRTLRLPDAIVVATGVVDDVDEILTADRRWIGVDSRVVVLPEE